MRRIRYEQPRFFNFSPDTGMGYRTCSTGSCASAPATCSFGCGAAGTCTSGTYARKDLGGWTGTCSTGTYPTAEIRMCTTGGAVSPVAGCSTGRCRDVQHRKLREQVLHHVVGASPAPCPGCVGDRLPDPDRVENLGKTPDSVKTMEISAPDPAVYRRMAYDALAQMKI